VANNGFIITDWIDWMYAFSTHFAVNGNYFVGGDKNCVRYRVLSSNSIMCLDKHGKETGYRNAMTTQELQVYMQQQQIFAEQAQAILDSAQKNAPKTTHCTATSATTTSCTTY
jgi:hypothetical protein